MVMRAGEVFTRNVAMLRADGKCRADRKVWQMEVLGNAPHHQPCTLPVIQPFAEEPVEYRPPGVQGLQ